MMLSSKFITTIEPPPEFDEGFKLGNVFSAVLVKACHQWSDFTGEQPFDKRLVRF